MQGRTNTLQSNALSCQTDILVSPKRGGELLKVAQQACGRVRLESRAPGTQAAASYVFILLLPPIVL